MIYIQSTLSPNKEQQLNTFSFSPASSRNFTLSSWEASGLQVLMATATSSSSLTNKQNRERETNLVLTIVNEKLLSAKSSGVKVAAVISPVLNNTQSQ